WRELALAGSLWISTVGLVMLAYRAWTERPWLARLVFVWWIVPFGLLSIGTSKMIHYSYPFLPPIALGAGLVADALFRAVERGTVLAVCAVRGRLSRVTRRSQARWWPAIERLLTAGAALALVVAVCPALAR